MYHYIGLFHMLNTIGVSHTVTATIHGNSNRNLNVTLQLQLSLHVIHRQRLSD